MKRFTCLALVFGALATPAAAAVDCGVQYKSFWDQFNNGPSKQLSGDQLAIVSRTALRAFDGCNAGDENTKQGFPPREHKCFHSGLREAADRSRLQRIGAEVPAIEQFARGG